MNPRDLGVLDKDHVFAVMGGDPESHKYKRVEVDVAGVPYLIEIGFAYRGGHSHRTMVTALNWSAAVGGNPFRELGFAKNLKSILMEQRCGSAEPISFFLHVASPKLAFLDRGKKTVSLPMKVNGVIIDAIRQGPANGPNSAEPKSGTPARGEDATTPCMPRNRCRSRCGLPGHGRSLGSGEY